MKKIRNKGITLIALVITIIILLILAGITIAKLTGSGLLEKAIQASGEAKYANATEKVALAVNASYDEKGELNSTQLKENLNKIEGINPKVQEIEYDLKVVVDGYEFTITKIGQITGIGKTNQLPENSANTKAGTEVALKEGWGTQTVKYIKTTDGTEVKTVETVATVYAVSDGENNTIPVPNGFYYVGGTKETGVVISDDARDKNKFINFINTTEVAKGIPSGAVYNTDGSIKTENLTEEEKKEVIYGNQFVWIPSTISEYKKEDFGYKNNDITGWDKTHTIEKTQIQKYSGFYVGRYEAGTSNAKFNTTVGGAITTNVKKIQNMDCYWQSEVYAKANTKAGSKPTSKAGEIPWFHADYETSYEMSEKMYNTEYVQSGLMTGTMWDTMINWMSEETNKADIKGNCKWGNYYDIGLSNVKGRYCSITSTSGTNAGSTSAWTKSTGTTTTNVYALLTTGSTEEVKKKNLYDVAGNLWEWVDESVNWGSYYDIYSLRGGSFNDAYATYPVCFRGRHFSTSTRTTYGFRVALYIK